MEDDRFLSFEEVFVRSWKNSRDFCKDIHISVKVNDCRIEGVNNLHDYFGFGRLSAVNLERGQNCSRRSCLSCGNYILSIKYHYFQTISRRDTTICMT